jgi:hypothetical protein
VFTIGAHWHEYFPSLFPAIIRLLCEVDQPDDRNIGRPQSRRAFFTVGRRTEFGACFAERWVAGQAAGAKT